MIIDRIILYDIGICTIIISNKHKYIALVRTTHVCYFYEEYITNSRVYIIFDSFNNKIISYRAISILNPSGVDKYVSTVFVH